jgi:sugar phosphate isomerase/epimerase
MPSRRRFLTAMAAGLATGSVVRVRAAGQDEIKTALNGPVGVQLWSFREYLPKDLKGTLAKIRGLGFREVEGAGLWKQTAADLRAALDAAGLRCQSAHMGFDRLRDDSAGAFAEARALGATWVVCPWISHQKVFGREDTLRAADVFNKVGSAAEGAGVRFAYHCHGYEFIPATEGTLFETLATNTDPKRVTFQIDVFHALHGGADPAQLITKYKGRVTSLHLKDLRKGSPIKAGTPTARPEDDVPVGSGQTDMAAVLRAAINTGVSVYYVEDESADPWSNIPQSLAYLKSFKP